MVCPLGLVNASSIFNYAMYLLTAELINIVSYVDDLVLTLAYAAWRLSAGHVETE